MQVFTNMFCGLDPTVNRQAHVKVGGLLPPSRDSLLPRLVLKYLPRGHAPPNPSLLPAPAEITGKVL